MAPQQASLCHKAVTYNLIRNHISAFVAVDPATVLNGCLEIAPGLWNENSNVPLLPSGIIDPVAGMSPPHVKATCKNIHDLNLFGYVKAQSI